MKEASKSTIETVRHLMLALPAIDKARNIAPYQGVFGWIGLHVDQNSDEEITTHVRQAYLMVAPKKLQALLGERI